MIMDYPLTITCLLERARRLYAGKEIATKTEGGRHCYRYADLYERVCRLANALRELGVRPGDRVGTFAWNTYRHLEVYFAVPCSGAVVHTLNVRLGGDQLAYVIGHAANRVLFVDESLLPLLEPLREQLPTVRAYVVMGDGPLPDTPLRPVLRYEDLLAAASPAYAWPTLDERSACGMCYTSGTTGHPKGVVYSHRGMYLHSLMLTSADVMAICERDVVLPVVPMFHANCWGLPYAAAMVGAKQVFAGRFTQPPDLARLLQDEQVTLTSGVPTIWISLLPYLQEHPHDLSRIRMIVSGGSAVPPSLFTAYDALGLRIVHAWGMTEMSPVGVLGHLRSDMLGWRPDEQLGTRAKQGYPVPVVEVRAVDDQGREVPWDGRSLGELQVRGPCVTSGYYEDERSAAAFDDGWFRTGDVASIDAHGYIQIADRVKDLVKSGGEWISSVDLESAIMGHPKVLEAAVIAVPHERWQERPLACVVPRPEAKGSLTAEEIVDYLRPRFPRWWLPDAVVFLDAMPKTGVGKFDKKALRAHFRDFQLA
ncbi:MAG: long-chain fatty acid--CoA ligase [Chloroflexi bacterium]|nr:long-chain fatty acid--CoA ligase [Chloroflexota bacterium]